MVLIVWKSYSSGVAFAPIGERKSIVAVKATESHRDIVPPSSFAQLQIATYCSKTIRGLGSIQGQCSWAAFGAFTDDIAAEGRGRQVGTA